MLKERPHILPKLSSLTAALCLALLCTALPVVAERLPVKTYTTADGLARDSVRQIVADSRGFLWFCTAEGLSRFDGYRFVNYGVADGLPSRVVYDLLETHSGIYWVATSGGVSRLVPGAGTERKFITLPTVGAPLQAEDLFEDHAGNVWVAAETGLYRIEPQQGAWRIVPVPLPQPTDAAERTVLRLAEDGEGALWLTTVTGLYRRWPGGGVERFAEREGLPPQALTTALLTDRQGRRWLGTVRGLYQLVEAPQPGRNVVQRIWPERQGTPHGDIHALLETTDGRLLLATGNGLRVLDLGQSQPTLRTYAYTAGLNDPALLGLAEDRDGNLWLASENSGAMKIAAAGFTSWNTTSEQGNYRSIALFTDQRGQFYWHSGYGTRQFFHHFVGGEFTAAELFLPRSINSRGWGWQQWILQTRNGEWWVPTGEGLLRYPALGAPEAISSARPLAHYTMRDGLPRNEIFRLYEDRRGDIWVSVLYSDQLAQARWERASGRFHPYPAAQYGLPVSAPSAYAENATGQLWMGFYLGGVARQTAAGWQAFTTADGLPKGFIRALYFDQRQRLWVATSEGGVARVDEPQAARPRFVVYTTAQGLASDQVTCVAEDRWGRVYLGTGRGVDRLEVESGRIKHFTTADGLASNFINVAGRDPTGALWFGTLQGISRLIPQPEAASAPPPVYLSGLRIAGKAVPLAEFGATQIQLPALGADKNQLDIEFVGLSYASGVALNYQYKLEGARGDWSQPSAQRTLTFANLAPGTYRLLVRAVGADGAPSPTPAAVHFVILPPLWQRWWFVGLWALAAAGAGYAFYRYRLRRGLELERVRMRIATELHDDIGTSLSRIALLSEVVKQQTGSLNLRTAQLLNDISESARELLDSMSDIVWSIDPRRDDVQHVVARIRQFASDVLGARHIAWELQVAPAVEQLRLQPEPRRQVYLIFKEALNNIAKHARCRAVTLELTAVDRQLKAVIHDDGCGFLVPAPGALSANGYGGHGLASMCARVEQLGGQFILESVPGHGTRLTFQIPLHKVAA